MAESPTDTVFRYNIGGFVVSTVVLAALVRTMPVNSKPVTLTAGLLGVLAMFAVVFTATYLLQSGLWAVLGRLR